MSAAIGARLRWALGAGLAFALGAACAGGEPSRWPEVRPDAPSPATRADPARDGPRVPADDPAPAPSAPSAGRLEGTWVAAPCGRRNYERRLELREGGATRMEERISPCPPGARCVWSGVEVVEGRWRRRDDAVLLALDEVARPMAVDAPARLTVTSTGGEIVLEEEGGCRYARAAPSTGADPAPAGAPGQGAEPAPLP